MNTDQRELELYDLKQQGIAYVVPKRKEIIYKKSIIKYPTITVEYVLMKTGKVYRKETIGGNEMVEVPISASYLSREDFETEDLGIDNDTLKAKVVDEGWIVPASESKFNRESFKITVELENNKEQRIVNLNNTSKQLLVSAYGRDSKGWVGKQVVIKGSEEKVAKKMQWVMYMRPKELKVK